MMETINLSNDASSQDLKNVLNDRIFKTSKGTHICWGLNTYMFCLNVFEITLQAGGKPNYNQKEYEKKCIYHIWCLIHRKYLGFYRAM